MRLSASHLRSGRTATVVVFTVAITFVFGYLWVHMGGEIPGVTGGYRVTAALTDAQNLVYDSDVRIAGVQVGKVRGLRQDGGRVEAVLEVRGGAHPLHEGATVRLRPKTLVEETYVEVVDGTGPAIADGGRLPVAAEQPSVRADDVLNGLDAPTRAALSSVVQRLGAATAGEGDALSAALAALGRLGREGHDALDVLAAQSEDLQALVAETAALLAVLDEGDGQIARLATASERVTRASADRAGRIEETLRALPGFLDRAREAAAPLRELSGALTPLAEPMQQSAADLRGALDQLPAATAGLRAVLPPLDVVLERAPATLTRTPPAAADLSAFVPPARAALADVNPMLAYLAPYGGDFAAFAANVAQAFRAVDPGGTYLRILVVLNEQSVRDYPVSTQVGPLDKSNAYPKPGQSRDPGPFTGPVPRVEEEP
jgi:phospholipid/cholesterol/gamma-HCH transport system substrate-binding protein